MEQQKQEKLNFDGIVEGGIEFPFVRLTVTSTAKILKKLIKPPHFRNALSKHTIKKRWWLAVRDIAFQKKGLWLWLGIVPKPLRCSVIADDRAAEIEDYFFEYAKVIVTELDRLSNSSRPSLTENKNKKETS